MGLEPIGRYYLRQILSLLPRPIRLPALLQTIRVLDIFIFHTRTKYYMNLANINANAQSRLLAFTVNGVLLILSVFVFSI